MRLPVLCTVILLMAAGCTDDGPVSTQTPVPPPSPGPASAVDFSPGNAYLWQHSLVQGTGWFIFWNTRSHIARDTLLAGRRYGIVSTGEILRSAPDSVYAWSGSRDTIWYRFDVRTGDTVPFLGHRFIVTDVRTQLIWGDSQKTVSVFNGGLSYGTDIVSGYYTSRFGCLRVSYQEGLNNTTVGLLGARVAGRNFGVYP